MATFVGVESPAQLVCTSDVEGGEMFLDIIRHRVAKCNGVVYVRNRANTWTCSPKAVECEIFVAAMYANILKDEGRGAKQFSSTLRGQTILAKTALRLIPDDPTFSDRLFDESIGKAFEVTGVPRDVVACSEVSLVVRRAGLHVSKQVVRTRMEALGCGYTKKTGIDDKVVQGFTGLKPISTE